MDKLLVLIASLIVISLITWWFFGKHKISEGTAAIQGGEQTVEIIVNGGYVPNVVTLKKGVPAKLIFNRKDPSGCLEQVVFPDFGINEKLPVNTPHEISIDTQHAGEFKYACGMNMFFGKVIVK